jgi:hypothetical protein
MRQLAAPARLPFHVVNRAAIGRDHLRQQLERDLHLQMLITRQPTTPIPPRPRIRTSV